ncbi:MAG: hypothetical protein ACMXYK_01320 [Candidatus Woesearchaeota archaeon]
MATAQLNMKFQETFLEKIKDYALDNGYMSIQELIREAVRDKIEQPRELRDEYFTYLQHNEEANTFSSIEDSKKKIEKLRKRVNMP